jgi:hypothetical protein
MSNVFVEIGHGIEAGAKDVIHGVEDVITVGGKVIRVIEDGKALTPQFKQELGLLVNDAKAIAAVVAPVAVSGGTNVAVDFAALEPAVADIIKLAKDVVTFMPTLEAALRKIGADING